MRWNPDETLQIDSSQNIDKLYIMNDDDEDSKVTNILFSDTSSDEEDSLCDIFVNSSEDEIVAKQTISKSKNNFKVLQKNWTHFIAWSSNSEQRNSFEENSVFESRRDQICFIKNHLLGEDGGEEKTTTKRKRKQLND